MTMTQRLLYKPTTHPTQIILKGEAIRHATGISWAGFWLGLAAMQITSQLIKAGII